ncbi:MAG: inositol monophosphatase [Gemmatimonadetes bacterium]|nr:inositol monophosphatase [Gemmatimonadota bacterium]
MRDHPSATPVTHPLLQTALAAAEAAAQVHLRWIGRVSVREAALKGTSDFVSQADLEAQQAAIAVISQRHPDHRVLAEEDEAPGSTATAGPPLWVLDPIDGTTNFLHGHPMYCVSVAVLVGGTPEAGVVACPSTSERWWATRGGGAFKSGRRIRVSDPQDLRTALVGTGFPFKALHLLDEYLAQMGRVLRNSAGVRRGGAAAIDLAYVASGSLDAFWELDLKPWDVMAGVLLIREAGGVVARLDGSPIDIEPGSLLAAANPELAEALRAVVLKG